MARFEVRRLVVRWLAGACVLCAAACSFRSGTYTIDGRMADSPEETIGWSTPRELVELADPQGADDPSLTADLREIYFGSRRAGGLSTDAEDIWMARRNSTSEAFGTPVNVAELNSDDSETTMKVTSDGLAIFFTSDRGGTGPDVWVSTRNARSDAWSPPTRVNELSGMFADYAVFAQPNLRRLVMCRGDDTGNEALYVSTRASVAEAWTAPIRLDELDEMPASECDPNEPHTDALYYASNFQHADGTFDIYRVERGVSTTRYGLRTPIADINLAGFDDRDPWVSADEKTMVFTSNRNGRIDSLYITTRD